MLARFGDFKIYLGEAGDEAAFRQLRMAETTGRPPGSDTWLKTLERCTGRQLAPQKRGPKPG